MSDKRPAPQVDVAIVGGGISGIYTAWRLLADKPSPSSPLAKWAGARGKLKVAVYEGSKRIGGRLLSARPPGMPHITCGDRRDAGTFPRRPWSRAWSRTCSSYPGMNRWWTTPRTSPTSGASTCGWASSTTRQSFPTTSGPIEARQILETGPPLALIGWAINQVVPGVQAMSGQVLRDFLKTATVDGTPLYQLGFWNLLARAMSGEALRLSRTMVGYDCLGSNANAVDLTAEYFDFTPDVKYYLIDGGYDLVPWTLEKLVGEKGGEVVTGAWLRHFDAVTLDDGTTGVDLTFEDGTRVIARSIVLAMPRRSLELLRPTGPVLDPEKAPHVQYLINSVEPIPLYKLCIAYPNPWWETYGVTQGRSLTDSPIRQCYYWAVEGEQPGGSPANRNAVIMAYNDQESVSFWGGLRRKPLAAEDTIEIDALARNRPPAGHGPKGKFFHRKPIPHPVPHATEAAADDYTKRLRHNWDTHQAPEAMVLEMHRQLKILHDAHYAPEPMDAAFVDWSDDPYGGGVHFWNPGYQSWLVLEEMIQPVADFPCYICGEAYSTNQTWAEGALQTAELALKKLGLAPPAWVTP